MHNLSSLLPQSIIDQIRETEFAAEITLSATPSANNWPKVRVTFNDTLVFDNEIFNTVTIPVPLTDLQDQETVGLSISYYNKGDNDTIVDERGNIIENQSVTIESIIVNTVDIVKTRIIYNLGMYHLNLSDNKKKMFDDLGISTEPTHTLYLCENGTWEMQFKLPIMKNFVQLKAFQKPTEHWPNPILLEQIYTKILEIKNLVNFQQ